MEERTNEQLLQELNRLKRAQARVKRRTTFLLCIIAMLVLVTSTLAWFTLSNFADIRDIEIRISTAPELYLDIVNQGTDDLTLWKKTLTKEMIDSALTSAGAPRLDDQLLDPVTTSDGISFFSEAGSGRNANDTSYVEFKVWFVATKEMWVHLSGQTVTVGDHQSTTEATTSDTGAKADIVKAIRLSFEDAGSAVIWEPNKDVPVNNQTTFDVFDGYSSDTRIFHLDTMVPKQITIRMWAEGNDPECDNDVQDANLLVNLLFGGTNEDNSAFE